MEALVQFIIEFWERLLPVVIIPPWHQGVIAHLSMERFTRKVNSGIHFKIPLLDEVITAAHKMQVQPLRTQSIRTLDGINLSITGALRYRINDLKQTVLTVQDWDSSLQDLALGLITEFVNTHNDHNCTVVHIQKHVMSNIGNASRGWGLDVQNFYVVDIAEHDVHRITGISTSELIED